MRKNNFSSFLILLVSICFFIGLFSYFIKQPNEKAYIITRVVDGDTLVVNGKEKIRLIGVDTPEYHYSEKLQRDSRRSKKDMSLIMGFGKVAMMFTRQQIQGKKVRLEYDWDKKDKYGRTLAYVFREPDNFFLNAEIIKQGYGNAYTRFSFKYLDDFMQYEKEARKSKKGLWADDSLASLAY